MKGGGAMEDCKNSKEAPACIPFFAHENSMMHYNHANKRMLIALLAVCITFVLTIVIFVAGYTVRERNWLNTLTRLQTTEVAADGVHKQPDP